MWFRHENYDGYYWLTREEDRHSTPAPGILPREAPERAPQEGDWTWEWFGAVTHAGLGGVQYRWVCNPDFIGEAAAKPVVEFPRLVTAQTLADFFKADPKKSEQLRLDETTTISHNKDNTSFTLSVRGGRLLWWGIDKMTWYSQNSINQDQVNALNKYLGKAWKLSPKNDLVGLENEKGEWILATQYAEFTPDGRVINKTLNEEQTNPWVKTYEKLVASVLQYLDSITPQKITEATAGMTSATHSVFTRCSGCQNCNGSHLEIHMARKDLDAYLIYSAYDSFGSDEVFGGALRQTWDLITSPTWASVTDFKSCMRKFLLDKLRSKVPGLVFMPSGCRANSNPWRLYGSNRVIVDGGVRLIANERNREEDPPQREGELIAEEVRAARPRVVIPERYRPAGINMDEIFINNRPVAIPPDPGQVAPAWAREVMEEI